MRSCTQSVSRMRTDLESSILGCFAQKKCPNRFGEENREPNVDVQGQPGYVDNKEIQIDEL